MNRTTTGVYLLRGGEPFFCDPLLLIYHEKRIFISIDPTGPGEGCQRPRESEDASTFSVDGPERTHDYVRSVKGLSKDQISIASLNAIEKAGRISSKSICLRSALSLQAWGDAGYIRDMGIIDQHRSYYYFPAGRKKYEEELKVIQL
jgi:hypothetical protein